MIEKPVIGKLAEKLRWYLWGYEISAYKARFLRCALQLFVAPVLIMSAVDYFKEINDRYGHDTGDAILLELANLVSGKIRKSDMLARWGGEEFILSCPGAGLDDAGSLAEKLRAAIERHTWDPPMEGTVTASFGVAEGIPGEDDLGSLLKRVDEKLYVAKGARNAVAI